MKTALMTSALLILFTLVFMTSSSNADDGDTVAIQHCLANWGQTPFAKKNPIFQILSAKVKVLGIGGSTSDELTTEKPNLVLIKANVAVLSKATLDLMNPQGWYCLKGQVSVLGKSEIHLHCSAHLTSSSDGATVMGASDTDKGVTVLGSTRVIRSGDCTAK